MLAHQNVDASLWAMASPRECPLAPGRKFKPLSPATPRMAYPTESPSTFDFQEGILDVTSGAVEGERMSKRYFTASGLRLVLGSPIVTVSPAFAPISPATPMGKPAFAMEEQSLTIPSFRLAPPPSRQESKCLMTIARIEREFLKRKVGSGRSFQGSNQDHKGLKLKPRRSKIGQSPLRSCFDAEDVQRLREEPMADDKRCATLVRPTAVRCNQSLTLSI